MLGHRLRGLPRTLRVALVNMYDEVKWECRLLSGRFQVDLLPELFAWQLQCAGADGHSASAGLDNVLEVASARLSQSSIVERSYANTTWDSVPSVKCTSP